LRESWLIVLLLIDPEAAKEMSQSQADAQKMLSEMPSLSQMFSKQ
jgi:hypothetical protein